MNREQALEIIKEAKSEISKKIVGQEDLVESIFIGLFGKGHILIEGVPGIAKTMTVNTVSKVLDLDFKRIQFTADLLPSDLIGTEIYNPKEYSFNVRKGPIFTNVLLADEINRSSPKVQSALLESMAEKQVTIGNETFKLNEPFIVLATQNPIEQIGTNKLPEAQLDRFMIKVNVDYLDIKDEIKIYEKVTKNYDKIEVKKVLNKNDIIEIQKLTEEVKISPKIYSYVASLIDASRNPGKYGIEEISRYIPYGISPRGGIDLIKTIKAYSIIEGINTILPENILDLSNEVLSHRIVLTHKAIMDKVSTYDIINTIKNAVPLVIS